MSDRVAAWLFVMFATVVAVGMGGPFIVLMWRQALQ